MKKNTSCEAEITPEVFAKSVVKNGLEFKKPKKHINLRLDDDVVEWYKKNNQGKGYQTYINALLKAYKEAKEAHQRESNAA